MYLGWSPPELHKIVFPISEACCFSLNHTTKNNMLFPSGMGQSHIYFTVLVLLQPHFNSTSEHERYYMYLQMRRLSILQASCFASHQSHEQGANNCVQTHSTHKRSKVQINAICCAIFRIPGPLLVFMLSLFWFLSYVFNLYCSVSFRH